MLLSQCTSLVVAQLLLSVAFIATTRALQTAGATYCLLNTQ